MPAAYNKLHPTSRWKQFVARQTRSRLCGVDVRVRGCWRLKSSGYSGVPWPLFIADVDAVAMTAAPSPTAVTITGYSDGAEVSYGVSQTSFFPHTKIIPGLPWNVETAGGQLGKCCLSIGLICSVANRSLHFLCWEFGCEPATLPPPAMLPFLASPLHLTIMKRQGCVLARGCLRAASMIDPDPYLIPARRKTHGYCRRSWITFIVASIGYMFRHISPWVEKI